jgi:flagellar basal body-associated protein FliL
MAKKKQANYIYIILVFVILALCISFGIVYFNNQKQTPEHNDKVCMSLKDYDELHRKINRDNMLTPKDTLKDTLKDTPKDTPKDTHRDYRVLNDQLYPPLNRTDTITHNMLETNISNRNMYVPTNDSYDKYRLIGYLVNKENDKDAGGNNWKLFAREKTRNTADFYIIPSNNNYDIKIHINDDIIKGERLRDIYTIPKYISFNSPMLNPGPYEFVEIPKADLSTSTRYL